MIWWVPTGRGKDRRRVRGQERVLRAIPRMLGTPRGLAVRRSPLASVKCPLPGPGTSAECPQICPGSHVRGQRVGQSSSPRKGDHCTTAHDVGDVNSTWTAQRRAVRTSAPTGLTSFLPATLSGSRPWGCPGVRSRCPRGWAHFHPQEVGTWNVMTERRPPTEQPWPEYSVGASRGLFPMRTPGEIEDELRASGCTRLESFAAPHPTPPPQSQTSDS